MVRLIFEGEYWNRIETPENAVIEFRIEIVETQMHEVYRNTGTEKDLKRTEYSRINLVRTFGFHLSHFALFNKKT